MAASEGSDRRPRRERVDRLLVERGLASTREKARALLLSGRVTSSGRPVAKAGELLAGDAPLEVAPGPRWVSRGGFKLQAALETFGIDPRGRDALDVGASTGGFTQVLLESGAARVVALDVGRGQLDWTLRNDPRVIALDGINARHLQPSDLPFTPSLATVDVSFISLALVLPSLARCLAAGAEVVALVKPQFEAGRGDVGRGGIVRDPGIHRRVLREVAASAEAAGFTVAGCARSTIAGAEGNREFFLALRTEGPGLDAGALAARIEEVTALEEPA